MRISEICEDNKIRGFDPFRFDWQFFTITSQGKFGDYLRMPGDIVASATIKGRLIAWFPFTHGSPRKLGEFYESTSDKLSTLGLQKLPISVNDSKLAYLYIKWDIAKKSTLESIAQEMISITASPAFRIAPPILYRGFQLTPDQQKILKSGDPLPLHKQTLSSWTSEEGVAMNFTRAGGCYIKKQFSTNEIFCNLHALDQLFALPLAERWSSEYEVLVYGNGIGELLDPRKEKLVFGKLTRDGEFVTAKDN